MPCAKWRRERRQIINHKVVDAPLDFSTRNSNLKPPPSYDQSIQNKMSRPSVIQTVCAAYSSAKNLTNSCDSELISKSTPTGIMIFMCLQIQHQH
mgnify:CR=1 FL=1